MGDLRVGLVGCGRIAERGYVPALQRAHGLRLAAVADPVSARCADVAPGVPAFANAPELIDAHAADALVLATPAATHLADARAACAAGIPTLVEKPPALTAADAAELVKLHPTPYVGFNRRFEPALQALRAAAAATSTLQIRLVLRRRRSSWPSYEAADPVALDLGPHLVDLVFWLSGAEAQRVTGRADSNRMSLDLELAGARGSASIECELGRPYRELVQIEGVGSFARGGWRDALRTHESPLIASLSSQLEAFALAVRGNAPPELATALDGLRVMRTLECVTS